MSDFRTPTHAAVSTPQGAAGMLTAGKGFHFAYAAGVEPEAAIALGMPPRVDPYSSPTLLPIFEMSLPEGRVLEEIRNRLAKTVRLDPMLLLALTGRDEPIGRVRVTSPDLPMASTQRVRLEEILQWDGAENLFAELVQRYAFRTGLAGVQPKVLVPEAASAGDSKALMATSDLIVKAGGSDYPGLAVNEFVCMSIAKAAGIPVPEFHLSANRELFVVRRFDRDPDARALGFEDMTVLMGKRAADKYDGSYEAIARAVRLFCAAEHVDKDLAQLFDQVALSCIVGNGDAHLKNFGVLYTTPDANDARLAPAFDIVNTTAYIPEDGLALSLGGNKSLFASRLTLLGFAEKCEIKDPEGRIRRVLAAVESTLKTQAQLLDEHPGIVAAIRRGFEIFAKTFGGRPSAASKRAVTRA